MSEVLGTLLSAVKPRPQLAKREVESASRFVLDETKFCADIMEEAAAASWRLCPAGLTSAPRLPQNLIDRPVLETSPFQWRQPFSSMSTRKPSRISGTVSMFARLKTGQGSPGAPQPHACGPSHGRSRWASQTQRQLSQRGHNFPLLNVRWPPRTQEPRSTLRQTQHSDNAARRRCLP
jgi:hypothetical protein